MQFYITFIGINCGIFLHLLRGICSYNMFMAFQNGDLHIQMYSYDNYYIYPKNCYFIFHISLEISTYYSSICLQCWFWKGMVLKGFSTLVPLDRSGCNLLGMKVLLKSNIHWPQCLRNISQVVDEIWESALIEI